MEVYSLFYSIVRKVSSSSGGYWDNRFLGQLQVGSACFGDQQTLIAFGNTSKGTQGRLLLTDEPPAIWVATAYWNY